MRRKKHREALRQKTQQQNSEINTTQISRKRTRKKSGGCGCGKKKELNHKKRMEDKLPFSFYDGSTSV
ncbi:hypothetical protein LC065_01260 [Halobacillus litoralis]|uniref:hypothetical protein n=1 Tax=Halobacillus litoralis TaxID=45668 RepID=UPI00273EEE86|nr:hypothetical protein [Halobacillus litoralis]WLR47951.1 hypothetical protein LC065_01260 [Halobacillus litoralis]